MHAFSGFCWIPGVRCRFSRSLITFHRLQLTKHSGFHRNLQLFPRVFDGFLELFIIRIDQVDASHFPRTVELRFIDSH